LPTIIEEGRAGIRPSKTTKANEGYRLSGGKVGGRSDSAEPACEEEFQSPTGD